MATVRVMFFEADTGDAGAMGHLARLVDDFRRGGGKVIVAPQKSPTVTRPSRGRGKHRMLVCRDFPGREFTADQARDLCGVKNTTCLAGYVRLGTRLGRKHVFEYADQAAGSTATAADPVDGGEPGANEDDAGGDDDDEPPNEATLWRGLKTETDVRRRQAIRNTLIEKHMDVVRFHATKMRPRLPREVETNDLTQAGVFGLIDAIEKFDPARGLRFATFAWRRVSGAMIDYLRDLDWVPRLSRSRATKLQKASAAIVNRTGTAPTRGEIADETGLGDDAVSKLIADGKVVGLMSLNKVAFRKENGDVDFASSLAADAPAPDEATTRDDWWDRMTRGLDRVSRAVVVLYYREQMTMREIGRTVGLCGSRVSQLHATVLEMLKSNTNLGAFK
jgi:RNA polymerase sigma factor FliA